jgi:dienelactone hydrolase
MATARLAKVRLTAADGGPLRLDIRSSARPGENRPAVLILHGFKGFKDWGFFPPLAERLALAGFTAVSFNFSGSGVGDGEEFDELERWGRQRPSTDLEDVRIVVDYAVSQGAPWVGLVGHSRGGGLAILQAARDPRIRAVVTWAAVDHFLRFSDEDVARWRRDGTLAVVNARTGQVLPLYRDALEDCEAHGAGKLNVLVAAGHLAGPWLIVHGSEDESVAAEVARRLSGAAGPNARLMIVEGAGHTFGVRHPWAGSTPAFDAVLDRTIEFLAAALP